jgi:hypothetical protein
MRKNSFIVKSNRLWNNLPEKLCLNSNIDLFIKALKKIYFEGYNNEAYIDFVEIHIMKNQSEKKTGLFFIVR